MKKILFILLALSAMAAVIFPRPSAAAGDPVNNLLYKSGKTVSSYVQNGHVSPDFWKARPSRLPAGGGKLKVIRSNDIWKLINQIPDGTELDQLEVQIKRGKTSDIDPDTLSAFNKLKKLGFKLRGYSRVEDVDDRFKIWDQAEILGKRYLIDTQAPMAAYDFLPDGSTAHLEEIEKLGTDAFRFIMTGMVENGRLAETPWLTIDDVDFSKGSYREWAASFPFDKDKLGWNVIVDENELYIGVNWSWIYKWNGKDWVDVSAQYPDYYKTTVLSGLKEVGFSPKLPDRNVILRAFLDAAAKGGPAGMTGY